MTNSQRQAIYESFKPTGDKDEDARRIAYYSKYILGDPENVGHYWIRNRIPKFHIDVYRELASDPMYLYITAPRGYAKSTIVQLVYVTYRIAYKLDKHILAIEKIDPEAMAALRKVKRVLSSNKKFIEIYGDLKPTRKQRMFDGYMWSRHEIKTNTDIFFRSIGMLGNARGGLEDEYRFTLIIGNDMQSIKNMSEPTVLEKHIDFWERDVEPAIDPEFGKVRAVGNMIDSGCLMESISKDEKYVGINISALVDDDGNPDIDGHSIWEDRFPTPKVHAERDYWERRGKLHVFMAEKMNIIQDQQKTNFAGYRYYNGGFSHKYKQNILECDIFPGIKIPVYIYRCIDPAYADTRKADPRAAVNIALGMYPGKAYDGSDIWIPGIWVLDYKYDRSNPATLIMDGINDHPKYHYKGIVIEANATQRIHQYLGIQQLQASEYVFKHPVEFLCVTKQIEEKFSRIYSDLQPKCMAGQFFIKPDQKELKTELELFRSAPRGVHLLDAIQLGLTKAQVCQDKVKTYDDTAYKAWVAEIRRSQREAGHGIYNNPLEVLSSIGMR